MNTPEEFAEKCSSSGISSFASAFDAFGLNTYGCGIPFKNAYHHAEIAIVVYNETPANTLVYNAEEVIKYLKAEGLYIPKEEIIFKSSVDGIDKLKVWYTKETSKM